MRVARPLPSPALCGTTAATSFDQLGAAPVVAILMIFVFIAAIAALNLYDFGRID